MDRLFLSAFCLLGALETAFSFAPGQRIDGLVRILHNEEKTQWSDVHYSLLPSFARPATMTYKVPFLKAFDSSNDEFKMQFSFAENRLAVPWVDIYDAKGQRRLEKLTLTFTHDDVDVLQVRASSTYTAADVDVSAKELEFTLETKWKRRVTEDVTAGVHTMCFLSVVLTIGAVTLVAMSSGTDDKQRHQQQQPRVVDRNKERFD